MKKNGPIIEATLVCDSGDESRDADSDETPVAHFVCVRYSGEGGTIKGRSKGTKHGKNHKVLSSLGKDKRKRSRHENRATTTCFSPDRLTTKRNNRKDRTRRSGSGYCQYTSVRNLALFRIAFFLLMYYEWSSTSNLTKFGNLDIVADFEAQKSGREKWFRYNHLDWIQELHHAISNTPRKAEVLQSTGYVTALMAAFGKELRIVWTLPACTFTVLYIIRFFALASNFSNNTYLFVLILVLIIFSGGGDLLQGRNFTTSSSSLRSLQAERKRCEAASVAIRAQFAVLYFFTSLWKLHGDWLDGEIIRGILLSFESQQVSRGIPWLEVEKFCPHIFQFLALLGLILDMWMFRMLAFATPRKSSTKGFISSIVNFHLLTALMMSQRIGYAFPLVCTAGIFIFLPFRCVQGRYEDEEYDASLVNWIFRYMVVGERKIEEKPASSNRKVMHAVEVQRNDVLPPFFIRGFVLLWIFVQFAFPFRMPIVSKFRFPFNRLGYRFSWTTMLHSHNSVIEVDLDTHGHPDLLNKLLINVQYYVPTCFSGPDGPDDLFDKLDLFVPRMAYMSESENILEDTRTWPLYDLLSDRDLASLSAFPSSFLCNIADGGAKLIDLLLPDACKAHGYEQERLGMHATYFFQMNGKGPYMRLVDPTVDLVSVAEAQQRRTFGDKWWGALTDSFPPGNEFILGGVGTFRELGIQHQKILEKRFPTTDYKVVVFADRSDCLTARPIWIRPLNIHVSILPLVIPEKRKLMYRALQEPLNEDMIDGDNAKFFDPVALQVGDEVLLETFRLEIGMTASLTSSCSESEEEDVLFALVFHRAV